MKIEIRAHRDLLSRRWRLQLERRLSIALRAFGRHIDEVVLTLRDVNGPRGGRDKLGQVLVNMRRGAPLVVRATDESLHSLVSTLAAAARRAVKARVRRRRSLTLRAPRRRGGALLDAALTNSADVAELQAA
jgi:hypothetical protein